jgi:hypothetical protein
MRLGAAALAGQTISRSSVHGDLSDAPVAGSTGVSPTATT